MATIRIRNIPEEAYATLRRRARREGRSIQAYMRDLLIRAADASTKAEVAATIEQSLARFGGADVSADDIAGDVTTERR